MVTAEQRQSDGRGVKKKLLQVEQKTGRAMNAHMLELCT